MKRIFPLLLACALLLTGSCLAYTTSDWAKQETAGAAVLLPKSLQTADLTKPITRGDFTFSAMKLYQTLTGDIAPRRTPAAPFSDVASDPLLTAQALGMVSGFPDGTFRPDDPLTRQQAAVILARTAALGKLPLTGKAPSFSDEATIGAWARDAVHTLAAAQVLQGRESGCFDPQAAITGQETLVMVQRLYALLPANSFAADLFAAGKGTENPVLSPVSAELCLGLVQAGAAGNTRDQLNTALAGSDLPGLNDALKTAEGGPMVEVANSIWFDPSVTPSQTYLDTVKKDYAAESQTLSLTSPSALPTINGWVKEKTHGLIPTILDKPLSDEVVGVLLNALYFKADWSIPFSKERTAPQAFTTAAGKQQQTDFMHDTRHGTHYFKTDTCTGVALPYKGDGSWWMLALLPEQGVSARSLVNADFSALLGESEEAYVALSLPKFTLTGTYDLTDTLRSMGLTDLFTDGKADLSPMGTCTKGPLFLSQVLQKTYLRVDEKGTEAAAVTGAIAEATSIPVEEPIPLSFDRPFVCCVWNSVLHQALFLGVVEDPS